MEYVKVCCMKAYTAIITLYILQHITFLWKITIGLAKHLYMT